MQKGMFVLLLAGTLVLAGCAVPTKDKDPTVPPGDDDAPTTGPGTQPGPGQGFAPQTGFAKDREGGLHLSVWFEGCKSGFCLDGLAKNEGTVTYYVSNICVSPFSDKMESEGKAVQPREPEAHCEAFGLAPFKAGAMMEANFTWDSRLWNDETGKMEEAPRGSYQWTMVFEAYEHQNGGDRVILEATVLVIVGET